MYGEEFIPNEYTTGRHRWFMKRHPPLCGNLPAWREWRREQQLQQNNREMLEALGYIQPAPAPQPVVVQ